MCARHPPLPHLAARGAGAAGAAARVQLSRDLHWLLLNWVAGQPLPAAGRHGHRVRGGVTAGAEGQRAGGGQRAAAGRGGGGGRGGRGRRRREGRAGWRGGAEAGLQEGSTLAGCEAGRAVHWSALAAQPCAQASTQALTAGGAGLHGTGTGACSAASSSWAGSAVRRGGALGRGAEAAAVHGRRLAGGRPNSARCRAPTAPSSSPTPAPAMLPTALS